MWENLPLFPEQASTLAPRVDALYLFLIVVSVFFSGLIFTLIFYFAVKYRRRSDADQPRAIEGSIPLEIVWTVVPFALTLVMFGWGAWLFAEIHTPPRDALEINVVGKQWMWKIQHPNGQQEINELHVPVGQPVKLLMTSEDVIHDFFVPAFRVKSDVLPGRYTQIWFHATKAGRIPVFLLAILRHSALGDDRPGDRDGDSRFSEVVERRCDGRLDGAVGRETFRGSGLRQLSPAGRRRAGALAGGTHRQTGEVGGRQNDYRRRELHSRIDSRSAR